MTYFFAYILTCAVTWPIPVRGAGRSSDNSSAPGRQMSPGVDDYNYDYDYETTLDNDEVMFDVDRLDVEYVDDLALAGDELDPGLEFGHGSARHGTTGHRRQRPHARYVINCVAMCFTSVVEKKSIFFSIGF